MKLFVMESKKIVRWIHEKGRNYNLFVLDENDYHDDDENDAQDPAIVLKQQKYATWLYVLLVFSKS